MPQAGCRCGVHAASPAPRSAASRFIAMHTSRGCIVARLNTGMPAVRASRMARPVPPVARPPSVQQMTARTGGLTPTPTTYVETANM